MKKYAGKHPSLVPYFQPQLKVLRVQHALSCLLHNASPGHADQETLGLVRSICECFLGLRQRQRESRAALFGEGPGHALLHEGKRWPDPLGCDASGSASN